VFEVCPQRLVEFRKVDLVEVGKVFDGSSVQWEIYNSNDGEVVSKNRSESGVSIASVYEV